MRKMYRITIDPYYNQYAQEFIIATDFKPVEVEEIEPDEKEVEEARLWCKSKVWDGLTEKEVLHLTKKEVEDQFYEWLSEDIEERHFDGGLHRNVPRLVDAEMMWQAVVEEQGRLMEKRTGAEDALFEMCRDAVGSFLEKFFGWNDVSSTYGNLSHTAMEGIEDLLYTIMDKRGCVEQVYNGEHVEVTEDDVKHAFAVFMNNAAAKKGGEK